VVDQGGVKKGKPRVNYVADSRCASLIKKGNRLRSFWGGNGTQGKTQMEVGLSVGRVKCRGGNLVGCASV